MNLFNIPRPTINFNKIPNLLHGPAVGYLEKKFAEFVGAKYAVAANSESSLIYLTFKHLYPSLKVTVPACIPPVVPAHLINAGATVLLRYTCPDDWVGRNYYLCDTYGISIIDSAQHVVPNIYADRNPPQSSADIMLFSFYPTKPLGGLEGGMFVTNDKIAADGMRSLVNYGCDPSENTPSWQRQWMRCGYKMYMTPYQAEVILKRLRSFNNDMAHLDEVRTQYTEKLLGYDMAPSNTESYHLFRIRPSGWRGAARSLQEELARAGVPTGIHYDALPAATSPRFMEKIITFDSDWADDSLTDDYQSTWLSIPFHSALTSNQITLVIDTLNQLEPESYNAQSSRT